MRIEQAVAFVNDLVFRPGWKISARPSYPMRGGDWQAGAWDRIMVTLRVETVDTNQEHAPEYRKAKIIEHDFEVIIPQLDEDDLLYEVLRGIADLNDHEDREFLRQRSKDYYAPLHPHKMDGQLRLMSAKVRHADRAFASR
jgi:hypothetical protein